MTTMIMHTYAMELAHVELVSCTCKDERSDCGDKSCKESVVGEGSCNGNIDELNNSCQENVNHVGIDQLEGLWRLY